MPPYGGKRGAELVVVATAPSSREAEVGRCLDGEPRQRLKDAIRNAGEDPDNVWITNVVLCRPEWDMDGEAAIDLSRGTSLADVLKEIKRENTAREKAERKFHRETAWTVKRNEKALLRWQKRMMTLARRDAKRMGQAAKKDGAAYDRDFNRVRNRVVRETARAWTKYEKQLNAYRKALARKRKLPQFPELPDLDVILETAQWPESGTNRPVPLEEALWHKGTKDYEAQPLIELPEPEAMPDDPGDTSLIPYPTDCCRPRLDRELEDATVVLAAGAAAFEQLTGHASWGTAMGAPFKLRTNLSAYRNSVVALQEKTQLVREQHEWAFLQGEAEALPDPDEFELPFELEGLPWPSESPRQQAWVLGVPHPLDILTNFKMLKFAGAFDLFVAKAVRIAKRGGLAWIDPKPDLYLPSIRRALHRLLRAADEMTEGDIPVRGACDLETDGLNPIYSKIRCAGLAWGDYCCVLPYWSVWPERFGNLMDPELDWLFRRVLAHPRIRKIFHNAPFDISMLAGHGYKVAGPLGCTYLAHHVIESEMPHALEFVGSLLTDVPGYKEEKGGGAHGVNATRDTALQSYCALDTYLTKDLFPPLTDVVKQDQLAKVYSQHIQALPAIVGMRVRGMYVLEERRQEVRERLYAARERCMGEMQTAIAKGLDENPDRADAFIAAMDGEPFSPSRPHHKEAMMQLFDVQTKRSPKTGNRTTKADDVTRELPHVSDTAREFFGTPLDRFSDGSAYFGYNKAAKLISTFIEVETDPDGRMRASWNPAGTKTGRYSCTDPNLMNIPEWVRMIYGAPPGWKLVGADYSGLELWVIAIYTGAKRLLEALKSSDVHRYNTEGLFSVDFRERYVAAALQGCPAHGPAQGVTEVLTKDAVAQLGCADHEEFDLAAYVKQTGSVLAVIDDGKLGFRHELNVPCDACREASAKAAKEAASRLKRLRVQAKRFVYNANYMGSVATIWLKLLVEVPDLQVTEVDAMMSKWKLLNPEIEHTAHMSMELYAARKMKYGVGWLESPITGRRRYWTGKPFKLTDASNYPIQSGAADIANAAIVPIYKRVRKLGGYLTAQVHDSFLLEVPERHAEEAKRILEEEMPGKHKFKGREGVWSFGVDAAIGDDWSEV